MPATPVHTDFAYNDHKRISEWSRAGGDTVRTIDYDAGGQVTAIVDSALIGPTCEWYDNYVK